MDSTNFPAGDRASVAILADSPTLTSGFGRTTGHIAGALARAGYGVACFGLKASIDDICGGLPYVVWPAEQGGHWSDSLPEFFSALQADVLLLNMDAYNALECLNVCKQAGWRGPIVSYVCFDGLPVSRAYLDAQRSCSAVWATSRSGAAYLRSAGVTVAGCAPPGVDFTEFHPEVDRQALCVGAGVTAASVIGVFATNTERKQLPRAIAGFADAVRRLPDQDLLLYLHCRARGHWDLVEIADLYGVADRLLFPAVDGFDEQRGVLTTGTIGQDLVEGTTGSPRVPASFSYVDRINLCDVLLNVPHSGDVEQVIIEGQACGVPLLHTDDEAIMRDAVGAGGVLLPAADVGVGRIGQRLHHVAPRVIGEALAELLSDAPRRASLRAAGFANVANYSWSTLEDAALAMVAPYTVPQMDTMNSPRR